MDPIFFESAIEFRRWLETHHASGRELLLGFYKKASGRGIAYREALDEALAFGWIDGVRKRLNDEAYTVCFTPRSPGSIWSAVNAKRAQELIALGRVAPPGLRAFQQGDQRKTRKQADERQDAALDPALEKCLHANPQAAAFFAAQPPGYRRIATFWVMSAKQEETRARRLTHLIELSANGTRIDLLHPNRK
jgi:uncharacterized protein YdeI (YjbR/CyaY-like superfamily)